MYMSSAMAIVTRRSTATSTSTPSSFLHDILATSLLVLLSCRAHRRRRWWESLHAPFRPSLTNLQAKQSHACIPVGVLRCHVYIMLMPHFFPV
jgi:hypothetical protein